MSRTLSLLGAIAIILSSGVAAGLMTDRWGTSREPAASAEKVKLVPKVIGDWEGVDGKELPAQDLAIGKIEGYLTRNYVNRNTGASVQVLLLCGRPGPIGVHTPDVCFVGAGHEL